MGVPITSNPAALIAALDLQPLPKEGGYFRSTWRTETGSAILYLITADDFSALHRLSSDEVWHFCAGDPVQHVQLDPRDGAVRTTRLGPGILEGDAPQVIVPAGVWQGARVVVGRGSAPPCSHGWSLLGCTMAPPWDENGFELAAREDLLRELPAQAAMIRALTR